MKTTIAIAIAFGAALAIIVASILAQHFSIAV
jgi:hypothetical protein